MQVSEELDRIGFAIVDRIFSSDQVDQILFIIASVSRQNELVRQSANIFAIRQVFKAIPAAIEVVFTETFKNFLREHFGCDYFIVKSIYFDKPQQSNWFVPYHQDLSISVDKKIIDLPGYGPWTVKKDQFAVQPPLPILQSNFTVRIHLDDTDENNGALRVITGSHKKDFYRPETIDWSKEHETICAVEKGGIMLMRPLLLHSSKRSTNNLQRRVLHIEFSKVELPGQICWSERINISFN